MRKPMRNASISWVRVMSVMALYSMIVCLYWSWPGTACAIYRILLFQRSFVVTKRSELWPWRRTVSFVSGGPRFGLIRLHFVHHSSGSCFLLGQRGFPVSICAVFKQMHGSGSGFGWKIAPSNKSVGSIFSSGETVLSFQVSVSGSVPIPSCVCTRDETPSGGHCMLRGLPVGICFSFLSFPSSPFFLSFISVSRNYGPRLHVCRSLPTMYITFANGA